MTQYTGEQLAIRITLLYYRVLMAEDQVSVASAALARAKEVDANVSDRVHSGLALDSDGERADLGWHAAQDDLASAKDNVALARMDLFDSLGTAVNDRPLVRPPSEVADAETHTADDHLKNRLDLQALDLQQLAQREMLSSIKASAWPQISTFGHVESDAQHMVKDGSWNWTVGAKVQMTLFDGGARRAREAEALANLHRLDAQQRSTVLAARSDIAAHKTQIEDLRRRLVTAESAIRVQRNALATSQDRYGNGLITISEVLNAESDLSAAEFQRVRTYYQLCIATAELAFTDGSQTTTKAEHP
jgi:OMF family outer membrane factor